MQRLTTISELEQALQKLCSAEPRFCAVVEQHGVPSLRSSPPGLEGLLMIVTEQFLSLKAAAAIWARVKNHLGVCSAETVLACSAEDLLALGLSRAKVKSFHAVAQKVASKDLDFANLPHLDETEVAKRLCELPGVGPWTADIYLLAVLGAADAWPAGDLALRIAIQNFLQLEQRPEISDMARLAQNWRPYRAVAARLLWSHYRGLRGMAQA